ncbi:SICA antigen [Plasmodium coatneyi]|uniref:SICA antigen n=1 Tax=Plasmodium coatneyi TaxID=208452 RepID=A0A1B1DSG2_9APIC|nr:SICA antigen [Plasmodium coatneyi]ANQ05721.1 SICA antigen [Plasmodium coatneyi]
MGRSGKVEVMTDNIRDDINSRVTDLARALSGNTEDKEGLCKSSDGSSPIRGLHKKVCKLITAGLKHIYEIKEEERSDGGNAKDKQLFKRTMSCFLLNAYADKLIKKSEEQGCNIIEKEIEEIFNRANTRMDQWCLHKRQDGKSNDCVKCTRERIINCEIREGANKYNVKTRVDELLNRDDPEIKKTFDKICEDCNKEKDLCERMRCVTENWFRDRIGGYTTQNWCVFWDPDTMNKLKNLSEAMTKGDGTDSNLCSTMEGVNKKACNLIVRGLKHIYDIQKGKAKTTQMALNNQQFEQTMSCVFLNAFADRLEQLSPCTPNAGVTHAFKAGSQLLVSECQKKGDTKCVECTRQKDLKCTLNVDQTLWAKGVKCQEEGNDDIKNKVDEMFNDKGKNVETQKVLNTINTINNDISLCARVQCVTVNWFKDRKQGKSTQNWCAYWGKGDVGRVLTELSKAMTNKNGDMEKYCDKVGDVGSAKREACKLITAGLEHIYKIKKKEVNEDKKKKPEQVEKEKRKAVHNQQFNQTMSCVLLNAFADKLAEQKCIGESTVQQAFTKGKSVYTDLCTQKSDPNCFQCTRQKNLSCPLKVDGSLWSTGVMCKQGKRDNMKKEVDEKLDPDTNKDSKVKEALSAITNICPPAPPSGPSSKAGKKDKEEHDMGCIDDNARNSKSTVRTEQGGGITVSEGQHKMDGQLRCSDLKKLLDEQSTAKSTPASSGEIQTKETDDSTRRTSDSQTPSTGTDTQAPRTATNTSAQPEKPDKPEPLPAPLSQQTDHPNLTSYLPLAPAVLGISAMTYYLWKV